MAVDPEKALVLYPAYFELRISRSDGRMVAKKNAIEGPTAQLMYEAVKSLGLDCILELEKSYPRFWYKTSGRVLVEPKMKKAELLEKVALKLKTMPKQKPS
jgi:signal recognition particle subunit SRP19